MFDERVLKPIAVFQPPDVFEISDLYPKEVLLKSMLPAIVLFILKIRGALSVVPIKLLSAFVPELPFNFHASVELPAFCQIAFPLASEVSILPVP